MKKLSKTSSPATGYSLINLMVYLCAAVISLLPFHAFLTVWASSIVGHYTLVRLWKEFALALLVLGSWVVLVMIVRDRPRFSSDWLSTMRRHLLAFVIIAYLILLLGMGLAAYSSGDVTLRAYAYGLLLDARFLIFFVVVWFVSRHDDWITTHWRSLLLIPAAAVVVFGLMQATVLPVDFLDHFGYGRHTIEAVQTIDQKSGYQRIQSTLRGANPLGAYLVLIIAALSVLSARVRQRRWLYGLLLVASFAVLALTYSRSAWIGAVGAILWLAWESIRSTGRFGKIRMIVLICGVAVATSIALVGYSLRNNDVFQNTFLHTDEHSLSATSSNQGHLYAARQGLGDIAHQPQGRGTGTAGPASVYNSHPSRISENYYLQIGQEAGILGLALFVSINLYVGRALWLRRSHPLAQVLLASLVGISLVNLLSHAWTDDTLSYIWWGLAGAALVLPATPEQTGQNTGNLQRSV